MNSRITLLSLCLVIVACGYGASFEQASELVDEYYTAVSERRYEEALDSYVPEVFDKVSRDELIRGMQEKQNKLGDIIDREFVDGKVRGSGIGSYSKGVQLRYRVTYQNHISQEVFFVAESKSNSYGITVYRFSATDIDQQE